VQSGGTRATAGTVYPISGYGCACCQRLYHSLVPTYISGIGLSPPLARKSGSAETRAGAEIKLGPEPEPEPEPEPGQGQGQWSTSLSSREMANPRAGSEAKAHIMAMSVTIPVAGASTSAHPTRGSRVLGRGQLYWSCSGSPSAT
ncbi:hypothetical protein MGE_04096, partial [Candida albicans P75010]